MEWFNRLDESTKLAVIILFFTGVVMVCGLVGEIYKPIPQTSVVISCECGRQHVATVDNPKQSGIHFGFKFESKDKENAHDENVR